jgi:hypothetical protein
MHYYSQIHEICFWGQGGYQWGEVYEMPIWLRKFTWNKLKTHYDKIEEQKNKNIVKDNKNKAPKTSKPNIPQSTYTAKAPKK